MIWIYNIEQHQGIHCGAYRNEDNIKYFIITKDSGDRNQYIEFLNSVTGLIGFNNISFDYQLLDIILSNQQVFNNTLNVFLNTAKQKILSNCNDFPIVKEPYKIPQLDLAIINNLQHFNIQKLANQLNIDIDIITENDIFDEKYIIDCTIQRNSIIFALYKESRREIDKRKSLCKKYNVNCINYDYQQMNKLENKYNDTKTDTNQLKLF